MMSPRPRSSRKTRSRPYSCSCWGLGLACWPFNFSFILPPPKLPSLSDGRKRVLLEDRSELDGLLIVSFFGLSGWSSFWGENLSCGIFMGPFFILRGGLSPPPILLDTGAWGVDSRASGSSATNFFLLLTSGRLRALTVDSDLRYSSYNLHE